MYKLALNADKDDIKELWAYAFDEQEPFLSCYFDKFWKAKNALVIKSENQLAAALQLIPYTVSVRNSLFKASYIVGVSVSPQFRGKKFSTVLMRDALLEQKKRGEAISLLIPFSYEFYKKLGYSLCYTLNIYETETNNIPNLKGSHHMKKMKLSDYNELNLAYENFCKDKNGCNIRTKRDWEYIFFEHNLFSGYIYGAYNKDTISGYVSYTKNNGSIYVRELVYNNIEALGCLLGFITSHFSNNETIKIRTAEDNHLTTLLKEPKNVMKVMPTVMARIVDIPPVLSCVNLGKLAISVYDDLIPENCGTYKKSGDTVIKTDSESFDAAMDISTLSQLVMGYKSASDLAFLGLIKANAATVKKLDKIFPKTLNYINHIMEA